MQTKVLAPVEIRRSDRKTLSIEITKDLRVLVRAPRKLARRDIDHALEQYAGWIKEHMALARARAQANPPPDAEEVAALRARAKSALPPLVEKWAARMGVAPAGVKITSAKTRYGSCSAANSICFSLYLMRKPMAAVEYVVVHELAHIVHKNHGPAFHALVARYLPDWKERRAQLRDGYSSD